MLAPAGNLELKTAFLQVGCALAFLAGGVALSGCDALTEKAKQAAAELTKERFGPWQSDEPGGVNKYGVPPPPKPAAPKPAVTPQFDAKPQEPRKDLVEFWAELDKACQSARKVAAPADDLKSGILTPESVAGHLATREGFTCSIKRDERSVSDIVSGGRAQSLRKISAVLRTESPQDVRAVVCVDESAIKIGTYVLEKGPAAGARQAQAYQLIWDVRLLSWPSRRVIARRELRGDGPPSRILVAGDVCGERPWTALNEWLDQGGEKLPQECDARSSHKQSGFALAISPDGKLLVSASVDGAIKLWALPDGTLRKTLSGHSPEAFGAHAALAISPDGKLLASSSSDNRIQLWTFPDGALVKTWSVGDKGKEQISSLAQISALEISPDNAFLASAEAGLGEGIKLWSLQDGRLLKAVPAPPMDGSVVSTMVISADGKFLASVGYRNITVRELPRGFLKSLRGHTRSVRALAISRDGKLLASASDDEIRLWGLPDGSAMSALPERSVSALAIHPDGTMLASGGATLKLWAMNGTLLKTLWGHGHVQRGHRSVMVDALAISPDGKLLGSGGYNSVRLWSLPEGRLKACLTDPEETGETLPKPHQ